MPKRGNWGDWAVIDLPPAEVKYVSCYACLYYYKEDGSCVKTSIIPHIDGNKSAWKSCAFFKLSPEYMTPSFIETVRNVKGNDYLELNHVQVERKPENNGRETTSLICDYEIGSWIKSDKFGTGRLIEVYPGKIVIDFEGKQRTFIYPESFDNCLLFLVHPPTKEDAEVIDDTMLGKLLESEDILLDNNELIYEDNQSIDDDNIAMERSKPDRKGENIYVEQKGEEHVSSFVKGIIGWVKRFLRR